MILVTGATGQIGRELVRLLARDQVPFQAFVRDPRRAREVLDTQVDLVPGDFADPTSLDRAMRDRALRNIDTLFVLSNDPALELNAVDAAIRQGVRRIVKSSAIGFRDQPPPGHGAVETAIRRSGLAYTILRPNAFMQTLAAYLPALMSADGTVTLPASDGRTAWVDTRDIAAVAAAVLQQNTHDGAIYAVTGPEALSMHDVAAILTDVTGTPIKYRDASAEAARRQMQERGLGAMADFLVAHYTAVKNGGFEQVSTTVADVVHAAPRSFARFAAEQAARWHPT